MSDNAPVLAAIEQLSKASTKIRELSPSPQRLINWEVAEIDHVRAELQKWVDDASEYSNNYDVINVTRTDGHNEMIDNVLAKHLLKGTQNDPSKK